MGEKEKKKLAESEISKSVFLIWSAACQRQRQKRGRKTQKKNDGCLSVCMRETGNEWCFVDGEERGGEELGAQLLRLEM